MIGSLRKQSFNRQLAHALIKIAPPELALRIQEIGDLPFYNDDHEPSPPASWCTIRENIAAVDAVLFLTPEYNRSVPAVLKNAIDVLSRPYGQSALTGKPAAVISASIGALGGFGANHHLRQSLMCLGVDALPTPEAYLGGVSSFFDADGRLVKADVEAFLKNYLNMFAHWIAIRS